VEFGFSTNECNSLRLVLRERFSGLFLDGSDWQVDRFNRAVASLGLADVRAVQAVSADGWLAFALAAPAEGGPAQPSATAGRPQPRRLMRR
jgi:hypothetical protein